MKRNRLKMKTKMTKMTYIFLIMMIKIFKKVYMIVICLYIKRILNNNLKKMDQEILLKIK